MTVSTALIEEELAEVVRDFPLPGHPSESRYLRRQVPRCLDVCGLMASHCPKDGRLLSVECEPGYIEILLKRYHGFDSIVGLSGRPSPGLSRRLAKFDIPMLEWCVDRDPIPEGDGAFKGVLLPRVPEHLREGLPHALTEFRRVLASGGILVLGTSNVAEFRHRIISRKSPRMGWPRNWSKMFAAKPAHQWPTCECTEREATCLLGEAGFLIDKVQFLDDSPRALSGLFRSLWAGFKGRMFFLARRR